MRIEPWGAGNQPLLEQLMGDPAMMEHLGGPETAEKIAERQQRYEAPGSGMFKIVDVASGEGCGSVGFWEKEWRDADGLRGRLVGAPGVPGPRDRRGGDGARVERARAGEHRFVHAFPAVDNAASNAICRKLGFTLLEARRFEYPPGHWMDCNDWQLDLAVE